jgi:hypothetical protein
LKRFGGIPGRKRFHFFDNDYFTRGRIANHQQIPPSATRLVNSDGIHHPIAIMHFCILLVAVVESRSWMNPRSSRKIN